MGKYAHNLSNFIQRHKQQYEVQHLSTKKNKKNKSKKKKKIIKKMKPLIYKGFSAFFDVLLKNHFHSDAI
jgi:SOS response regulatory protein OraA/RecX